MNLIHPVISVIGAGAVGGYYGARLSQNGFDVHFQMRNDAQAVRQSGLRVTSPDGDVNLPPEKVHVYEHPRQMPKSDLILVTLKTTANDQFRELIEPVFREGSAIVTLQNGLGNEDQLAELFGAENILGGMAFVCINRTGAGQIAHLDHGLIQLGEFREAKMDRANRMAEMFTTSKVPCRAIENLIAGRWEKLVWNIPFNGLGALLDLTTDQLLASDEGVEFVRNLMAEVIAIAASEGIHLPDSMIEEKINHTKSMGAYRTSMQIDRQLGRDLEAQTILGNPLAVARRRNVATPYLEMVYTGLSATANSR